MATSDVPGANPVNNDELHPGCWAEHRDGSLLLVEGTENDRTVFSVFDISKDPPLEYRDAMPESGFKKEFTGVGWTWHDKTEFPWDRIMKDFKGGFRYSSAGALMTEAERVAHRRSLHGQAAEPPDDVKGLVASARDIVDRLQNAINRLRT